jgi:hypothetical protein
MPRDEIVAYLERYAAWFEAPLREGVDVTSLQAAPDGGFLWRPRPERSLRAWSS